MNNGELRVYGYRWVVLAAFVLIASMTQVLWITFAPITRAAASRTLTKTSSMRTCWHSLRPEVALPVLPGWWRRYWGRSVFE